jgi:hypothetical protein
METANETVLEKKGGTTRCVLLCTTNFLGSQAYNKHTCREVSPGLDAPRGAR